MELFFIGLSALLLSYLLNKAFLGWLGDKAIYLAAPAIEEILKSIPAYCLNRPIWPVHLFFGIGEALYDYLSSRKRIGKWAAVFSILSHGIFGAITAGMLYFFDNLTVGLFAAVLVHGAWNYFIMRPGRQSTGC